MQCDNRSIKRRDLFVFIRITLRVAAMYPLGDKQSTIFLRIFDSIYELFNLCVSIHIAGLYICTIYINYAKGDLDFFVSCLIQTIIYLWTIIMKLYFRRIRPNLLNEILEFINKKYILRSSPGFTYVTMAGALKQSNLWIKSYVYCCYIGTIFWLILPIAYRDNSLPLACWYPFDYTVTSFFVLRMMKFSWMYVIQKFVSLISFQQPIVYECVFFIQAIGQIQVAATFASSSGFHMVLAILISGQYDVLYSSLKNVLATTYTLMGATRAELGKLQEAQSITDVDTNQYNYSVEEHTTLDQLFAAQSNNRLEFRIAFNQSFKRCLQHHRYIIKALQKMENFYNPIWFAKIGEVTFLMCLVAFVSTKSTQANSVMRMVSLGQYLLLVLYELFIICYFAELIYQNSQECGAALWRSPWHLHLREVHSDYLFFLLNAQRKFQLTAGKIYNLNVERFRGTITTAFSFLTLLQKMDARG